MAAKKKRKASEQRRKQIERIKRTVKGYWKKGYRVNVDLGKVEYWSLKKLAEFTYKEIRKLTSRFMPETGEEMTYAQYQSYLRMLRKKEKELPKPPEEQPVDISIVNRLRVELSKIPDVRYGRYGEIFDSAFMRNMLEDTLEGMIDDADNDGTLRQYIAYLLSIESELLPEIEDIQRYREGQDIEQSYDRAMELIKGVPLTLEEKKQLTDEMNEPLADGEDESLYE